MNFLTQQQEVASQLRLDLTQSDIATIIKRWLNQAQQEIWAEADWYFALDRQIVQTVADITTGTVSISAGGTTVTGSSTTFSASDVSKFIQFSSSADWYKITAVASDTSLTIEAAYTQTTALSAGTYTIRKFFYSVDSTVDKILSARQAISPLFLDVVHFRDFDIFRPDPTSTGNPNLMFVYGLDSSNNIQFTVYPWPDAIINIEVRYKKVATDLSADGDVSLIPAKWHSTAMLDGALYRGLRYLSNGNADMERKAEAMRIDFKVSLRKLVEQQNIDESYHAVIQNRDVLTSPIGPSLPYKYGIS